jgi:hypothetical protein
MKSTQGIAMGLALVLFAVAHGDAASLTLQPSADTTLFEIAPDNNLGGADFLNAGTAGNGNRNRGLMVFDLTGVPVGSVVTEVTLSVEVVRQPVTGLENSLFSLRRVFQPWGEGVQAPESSPGLGVPAVAGEATWTHRFFGGATWSQPGGEAGVDFADTASALTSSGGQGEIVTFESSAALIDDVNSWINQAGANFGWMLVTESEELGKTARSFASRESGFGPTLTIEYTPVPEPGTMLFLAAGLAGLVVLRRST